MMIMPGISEFDIAHEWPGGLPRSKVSVDFNKGHDRTPLPDFDEDIEVEWTRRIEGNPGLFNGAKFRFAGIAQASDGKAELQLGMTDYKTFIGTNMSPEWQSLLARSNGQGHHMANTLANAALVSTQGGELIMLARSGNVGECPNVNCYPGGHPEPSDLTPPLRSVCEWASKGALPLSTFCPPAMNTMAFTKARKVVHRAGADSCCRRVGGARRGRGGPGALLVYHQVNKAHQGRNPLKCADCQYNSNDQKGPETMREIRARRGDVPSPRREVCEETGIAKEELSEPLLLGIAVPLPLPPPLRPPPKYPPTFPLALSEHC